jgi:hypothetical protein
METLETLVALIGHPVVIHAGDYIHTGQLVGVGPLKKVGGEVFRRVILDGHLIKMPPALGGVEVPGVGDFGVFVGDIVDKV